MEKGFMGLPKDSMAEYLARLNNVGGFVQPVRMNPRRREILLALIEESKENTYQMTDKELDSFLTAMMWLEAKLTGKNPYRLRLNKDIGLVLNNWTFEFKYHHESGDPDFFPALQWVVNQISKHYSTTQLYAPR